MFRIGVRRLIERTGRVATQRSVEQNLHLVRNVFFHALFGRYLVRMHVLSSFQFRDGQRTAG